jgi:hypothetical protein
MAGLLDVGYVSPLSEDVLPSTGAHLDVRVRKDGKYINPETIRSLLTRLKVGKERTPLWQQQGEQWKATAPITSGFGPRTAPVAGASTYHPAHDYGVGAGTPLAWEGPGTFTPGKGYGTIKTTDAQGNPYEISLLHTKGGKAAASPVQPGTATPPQAQQKAPGGDTYIIVPRSAINQDSENQAFLNNYMNRFGYSSAAAPTFDAAQMLINAFNQTPNYMS